MKNPEWLVNLADKEASASPAPWVDWGSHPAVYGKVFQDDGTPVCAYERFEDAQLILALRNDFPKIMAHIADLHKAIGVLEGQNALLIRKRKEDAKDNGKIQKVVDAVREYCSEMGWYEGCD